MTVDDPVAHCAVQVLVDDTFGSGFFVAESTVLTCAHVVDGRDRVGIVWNGTELTGTVIDRVPAEPGPHGIHEAPDLAVITLDTDVDHPCLSLAPASPRPVNGTNVTVSGYSRGTVDERIGRDSRYLTIAGLSEGGYLRVTQDSVPSGMSGAPVVDEGTGRVVGVMKASVDRGGELPHGGWIITVAMIEAHLPGLVTGDRRAGGTDHLAELASKDEPPHADGKPTPSQYLDPRRRIVGFLHRPELGKLVDWCRAGARQRVRLLSGPGGAGKSRLSVELVHRVRDIPGWTALRIRRGDVDLDRLVAALEGRKVLLCLEDGEEWAYDLPAIMKVKNQEHLRILMLVRTRTGWWRPLTERLDFEPQVDLLAPLGVAFDRAEILERAYHDFRGEIAPNAPSGIPPVLAEAAPDAANALDLLAAALAVVLHCREHDGQPPTGEIRLRESLHELLVHERKWWYRWARDVTRLDDPAAEREIGSRVLLLPALFLAADTDQGKEAAAHALTGLNLAEDLPGRVVETLRQVWPPPPSRSEGKQCWDALRPDPLGERLVLEVLSDAVDAKAAADLVKSLFAAGVDRAQAEHALTVLARAERAAAGDVRDRVVTTIRALLESRTEVFLPAGMSVATGLNEPATLIDLMRGASVFASEQTLDDAAAVAGRDDSLASLEADLLRMRAEKLLAERVLTASQRLAVADLYRRATDAHVRAEENDKAVDAVRRSVESYAAVPVAFRGRDFAKHYASVSEMAAEATKRVGNYEEALTHARRATDLRRGVKDDDGIQRGLRFETDVLELLGRSREAAAVRKAAREHFHGWTRRFDQWAVGLLRQAGARSGGWGRSTRADDGDDDPRPTLDDPARQLVIPVGHFAGPMYTSSDARSPESFEVRFRDGIFSLSSDEYAVWAVSHGNPNMVREWVPSTREVVERAALAAGVSEPEQVFDSLIADELLVEIGAGGGSAREFAKRHRVVPLALGLGNSPQNPGEFQIGLPNAARIAVGFDVYHMWLFSYRAPTLWDALRDIADEAKRANEDDDDVFLTEDPDLLLEVLLRALQVLISTSCVFIDRCD